jgi:hypothetical protein
MQFLNTVVHTVHSRERERSRVSSVRPGPVSGPGLIINDLVITAPFCSECQTSWAPAISVLRRRLIIRGDSFVVNTGVIPEEHT